MVPEGIQVYSRGALLNDAWFIMMSQLIITPLLYIFSPWYYLKEFQKWLLRRHISQGHGYQINQKEANQIYESPIFDPAFAYAAIIRDMFMVIFLQPLFPFSGLIGLFCIFFLYWSQKYRLLRHALRPIPISVQISRATGFILSLGPLVYGVGLLAYFS